MPNEASGPADQGRRHSRSFAWRGIVGAMAFAPAVTLLVVSTPVVEEGSILDWAFDVVGWLFLAAYVTFRLWATLFVGGRKDKALQTEGIYSATRNPLYVGSACLALAAALFFQSILLFGVALAVSVFYLSAVVRSEEVVLRARFGAQFDAYARSTPRFIPSFSGYHSPATTTVDLAALGLEARRLWGAIALPIVAELLATLRASPDWPHWFRLL